MEWSWYRRLDGHDLPEKQFLVPPGAEVSISPEDDVDGLGGILEFRIMRFVPLVIVFRFFVHWLILLAAARIAKCPPEVVAINCCMIGT
jgi:hypothetical protein